MSQVKQALLLVKWACRLPLRDRMPQMRWLWLMTLVMKKRRHKIGLGWKRLAVT